MKLASDGHVSTARSPSAGGHAAALLGDERHARLHGADVAQGQAPGRLGDGVEVVRQRHGLAGGHDGGVGDEVARAGTPPSTTSWRRCASPPAGPTPGAPSATRSSALQGANCP